MSDLIKGLIGKDCCISTMKGDIIGKIEIIDGNWILVSAGRKKDIINLDYIVRINEVIR